MSDPVDLEALVAAARDVRERAYAPYSRFLVGAAVSAGGRTFVGANFENASYGVSICAERSAVAAMIAAGERRIDAVAVAAGGEGPPASPCGACRQVLSEFAAPEVPIVSQHVDGRQASWTMGALLPAAFSLDPDR
ncbi:MAG: cytidine deaminase [Actinomycetota bacterium]